ncbi:MAG: DNA translocase FtsK 4TM domain-containing protein [Geminicoccaceae bacterium]
MAASTIRMTFDDVPVAVRLAAMLRRVGGVLLILAAVGLAVALIGYDIADPSLNTATGRAATNPAGPVGAAVADILLQLFGRGAWLVALVLFCWGLRLVLRRPLQWPWLPVFALPLALLAVSAALATLPVPPPAVWPLSTSLGGLVGDLLMHKLEPVLGTAGFAWAGFLLSIPLAIAAMGLRWGESTWAAGKVGRFSRWAGWRIGRLLGRSGRLAGGAVRGALDHSPGALAATGSFFGRFTRRLPGFARVRAPAAEDSFAFAGDDTAADQIDLPKVRMRRRVRTMEEETTPTLANPVEEPVRRPAPRAPAPEARAPAAEPRLPAAEPPTTLRFADLDPDFELPGLDLLAPVRSTGQTGFTPAAMAAVSRQLETVLDDFGVRGEIVDAKPGPVVTLHELEPAPGTRAARVIALADDIARSLCARSVRVAVVPGRNVIGIELPNEKRETVYLRELLQSDAYCNSAARLPLALGKDIAGNPVIADLARMPHLLIAGTTGSGKSVAINAMILSLLYRLTPAECRVIMIDPKVIELSVYEDIPHLLAPVVTEPHKAVVALKWVVRQMDERYRLMSHLGVRDIFAYNRRIQQAKAQGEELKRRVRTGFEPGTGVPIFEEQPIEMRPLPLMVVIVDEVADLMLTAGKEIESAIQRLSQKARAAGIHLIVATQRPSVDVLTGVIKANLPSRISFRVSSKIDSRTILGEPGAEQLLGQGDMLYLMPGDRISRIHGALVTDSEVEHVARHLKAQGEPDYVEDVTEDVENEPQADGPLFENGAGGDALYNQAVQVVARDGKASTSYLQRKLSIGYNSAAKLIERMEQDGLITPADHVGRRQVLMGRGGVDGTDPTERY